MENQNGTGNLLQNTSVLVTGGAGFIGSNLVEALLRQGNRVTCLDNFITGKRKTVEAFMGNPAFRMMEGDIRNPEDCRKAVEGVGVVLHQAALGSVPRSIKDPRTSNDVNIGGFVNMLIAARDAGIRRFVYASSSSVYGDHAGLPKVEEETGNPMSPYAVTKRVNELYGRVFSDLYGMELIGLRYFNVFGKRQDPEGPYAAVIPRFVKSLINHEPPVIHGDGTQSRDFTYIDHVVGINQLAAVTENKDALNRVYNVACGANTTISELFSLLRMLLARFDPDVRMIEPVYGPERPGDVKHSLASIRLAAKYLGYDPRTDVRQGLEMAIEWYWKDLR
ncbi:MAG: SDR family oxidoreductase [Bacteroidales bacterium]|nr:SDR family oxidoreductase [Bacteroidales bacterium]